jgi:hypothetical protein
MRNVRLPMSCTVHGEGERMGILIVSLAVLLSSVIGAVPVSAESAVSCGKQRPDVISTVSYFPT